jgi:hypothetical protein
MGKCNLEQVARPATSLCLCLEDAKRRDADHTCRNRNKELRLGRCRSGTAIHIDEHIGAVTQELRQPTESAAMCWSPRMFIERQENGRLVPGRAHDQADPRRRTRGDCFDRVGVDHIMIYQRRKSTSPGANENGCFE